MDQLEVSPEASGVEVNGKTVYRAVRPAESTADAEEPWTDAKNHRRAELIDKGIARTITPAEAVELEELTRQMRRYRDRVAPLPLDHVRGLHKHLKKQSCSAAGAETGGRTTV